MKTLSAIGSTSINVTTVIDENKISPFQIRIFLLCGIVVFLDGIDFQIVGIAAPLLSDEFGFARSSLGWVFSAGTLGAALGALACGLIADRFGRKVTLVATTALFGALTIATSFTSNLAELTIVRFITGLGLGGAVPCFIALTSEYAPSRRRAAIVSFLWAAFPLGGMTGGFVNSYLIHAVDWRYMFFLWGGLPIFVAIALGLWMPESIRFLLTRRDDGAKIRTIVSRMLPGPIKPGTTFIADDPRLLGTPLKHLFIDGRAKDTFLLWVVMFIAIGVATVIVTWMPALITAYGFTASDGAIMVGFFGLGSFIGTSTAGSLIERFGVAKTVVPGFLLAAAAVFLFGQISGSFVPTAVASFFAGLFVGLSSSSGVTLSAVIYPTAMRSTGIGWAMGLGRFGSVLGPLAVGQMVAVQATVSQIFLAIAIALLVAIPCVRALSLGAIRLRFEGPRN